MHRIHSLLLAPLVLGVLGACQAPASEAPALEVVVIGTTHSRHLTSEEYGLDELEQLLRNIAPDAVLTEIPPDRFPLAAAEFAATGTIEEPRVSRFPEYTDVLFPLQSELGFEIFPCAGWTTEMASERSRLLAEWRETRPEDTAAVNAGQAGINEQLEALGLGDRPSDLHDPRYDEIVRLGLVPYQALFGDDLGPGGWDNINIAHWSLLDAALDRLVAEGEAGRVAITYGASHKYWFLDRLAERDDVVVLDTREFL